MPETMAEMLERLAGGGVATEPPPEPQPAPEPAPAPRVEPAPVPRQSMSAMLDRVAASAAADAQARSAAARGAPAPSGETNTYGEDPNVPGFGRRLWRAVDQVPTQAALAFGHGVVGAADAAGLVPEGSGIREGLWQDQADAAREREAALAGSGKFIRGVEHVGEVAGGIAPVLIPGVGIGMTAASMGGGTFEDAKQQGASDERALTAAGISAAAGLVAPGIGGKLVAPIASRVAGATAARLASPAAGRIAGATVEGAGAGEALTVGQAGATAAYNPQQAVDELKDPSGLALGLVAGVARTPSAIREQLAARRGAPEEPGAGPARVDPPGPGTMESDPAQARASLGDRLADQGEVGDPAFQRVRQQAPPIQREVPDTSYPDAIAEGQQAAAVRRDQAVSEASAIADQQRQVEADAIAEQRARASTAARVGRAAMRQRDADAATAEREQLDATAEERAQASTDRGAARAQGRDQADQLTRDARDRGLQGRFVHDPESGQFTYDPQDRTALEERPTEPPPRQQPPEGDRREEAAAQEGQGQAAPVQEVRPLEEGGDRPPGGPRGEPAGGGRGEPGAGSGGRGPAGREAAGREGAVPTEAAAGRKAPAGGANETLSDLERRQGGTTVREHDVPYGGGTSSDGRTVYIDREIPRSIDVNGQSVDPHTYIAIHERAEKPLMDRGMSYAHAHELATKAEHRALTRDGIDPQAYEAALKPFLDRAKARGATDRQPPDLEPKPYREQGEEHLLRQGPAAGAAARPGMPAPSAKVANELAGGGFARRAAPKDDTPTPAHGTPVLPESQPSDSTQAPPSSGPGSDRSKNSRAAEAPSGASPEAAADSDKRVLGYGPGGAAKEVGRVLWGDRSALTHDVVPKAKAAAEGLKEAAADIRRLFAPQTAGEQATAMKGIAREHGAELALRADRALEALRTAKHFFDRQPVEMTRDFIDRMEAGREQTNPALDQIAKTIRDILDTKRTEIQMLGKGKLEHFIEDYFPHIWKDPKKAEAVFSQAAGKRPLEGAKSFMKKRTIPTVRDGIDAGLEPASENPVDLVLLKAREMDKYLLGQRMLAEMKERKLAQFVRATDKAPEGLTALDDRIAQVYGPPTVTFKEYVDKQTYDALDTALKNLGVQHDRRASVGRGRLGYSVQGGDEIATQSASDLSVIAHELGHQLDHKLGLGKLLATSEMRKETGKLADLHGGKRAYFRSPEERVASVVEAYVHAPQRMQELAPKTWKLMRDFIDQHPQLAPLKDIKPSLELQKLEFEKAHGGLLKMGAYYAPEAAANVFNNYLSPGLRGRSGLFRAYMGASNFLNQAQLGLSAFHLGFTSLDAVISKFAIGLMHLKDGSIGKFAGSMAATPMAPFANFMRGNKVLSEWYRPGSQGAEMAQIVDSIRAAGGRAKMDLFYQSTMSDRMFESFRRGNVLGGLVRLPFGAVDLAAKPIMDYLVPRQKLGVFADMAKRELAKLPAGASRAQVRETMAKAWDSVDNRMGQMVYDNLFWQKSVKDLSMASVRSLGWNIGTLRELGGAIADTAKAGADLARLKKPEFTYRMSYAVALPVVAGTLGATLQYLMTGQGPQELKDYFFPKTGEKDPDGHDVRLSLPSYMKDVYQYAHSPGQTLQNKLHPMIGMAAEMLRNKDYYGTEIRHPDDPLVKQALELASYVGKSAIPFGIRNAMQESKDNVSTGKKVAGFFGVTKAPYWLEQSKAEIMAADLMRERMPAGTRTAEQAQHSADRREISGKLRSKDDAVRADGVQELNEKMRAGEISPAEARSIHDHVSTGRFEYEVKHLDIEDAMKVWRASEPAERKQILELMRGKLLRSKSLTPEKAKGYLAELKP